MSRSTRSLIAMAIACTIWGLSPLYYAQLRAVPPVEVLSWRAVWSLIFFAGLLIIQGRLHRVPRALSAPRQVWVILAAGLCISLNWFGFIYSVQTGHAVEASLGYYIFPLVAVLLGRLVFGEDLGRLQWGAVALATAAVLILGGGLGAAPWIALLLAFTFGFYGVIKKRLAVDPVVSVTAEVLLLAPLALVWIFGIGQGVNWPWRTLALLAVSGPLTGAPLILFSYAAKGARLSTVGLVQYLNPTLQFLIAVRVFAEPATIWHIIAFPLIWAALTLYSVSALRQERARRRVVSSVAMSGAMVK